MSGSELPFGGEITNIVSAVGIGVKKRFVIIGDVPVFSAKGFQHLLLKPLPTKLLQVHGDHASAESSAFLVWKLMRFEPIDFFLGLVLASRNDVEESF